ATLRATGQVSGPVVAIGLVLAAVFVPAAFISGITGQFFRQFALTIAVSTLISAFNSLTLSPALSALLLRRRVKGVVEPLPAFVFALFGAWLGHKLGRRHADEALAALTPHLPAVLQHLSPTALGLLRTWGPTGAGALAGLLAGEFLGRPVNAGARPLFRLSSA